LNAASKGEPEQTIAPAAALTPMTSPKPDNRAPTIVPERAGSYRILRRLGTGTFGPVYLARGPDPDHEFALRVFEPASLPWLAPEQATIAFLEAASTTLKLRHEHIATVFDVAEEGGIAYMAVEHVHEGRTLRRFRQPDGNPLPIDDVVRITRSVADALHYAHEQGVIHHGVRPGNILLGVGVEPKLTDFGLDSLLAPGRDHAQRRACAGDAYLSPEQIFGRTPNHHTDIFSLGVVLYELLGQRHPFPADTLASQHNKIVRERHIPVRKYRSDTPRVLEMISNRCLSKRPSNRYKSAMHLAANLEVAADVLASSSSGVAKAQIFMRIRRLKQFSDFSEHELKETVLNSTYCTFKPGDEIIAEGDMASCLYIVIDGEVGVRMDALDFINRGPGECVGEVEAITGEPRTATVIALDRCGLLSIPTSFIDNGPVRCQLRLKNLLLHALARRVAGSQSGLC
jgi:eukaryotic-like serine/threonine-protein kinase